MRRIRGGRGLGDALYLRPIVDHFISNGEQVTVCCDYTDIFSGSGARVERFTRDGTFTNVGHYTWGKANPNTTQWQDVCTLAGVPGLALSFKWQVRNERLTEDLLRMARGKPIIMVNGGRPPMDRRDGFAFEMLPRREAFDAVLAALDGCFTVEVGKGAELYPLSADVDLSERTSPGDLLDIAWIASGLVGQCSFMIPLAEAFDKPLMVVWGAKGLQSATLFIRQCTPQKILSKPSSRWVMDDWSEAQIQEVAHAFRAVL